LGSLNNPAQADANIANEYIVMDYTVNVKPEICGNDGVITLLATGNPATFAIIAGPVTRPAQASNIFTGLPGGTYTLSAVDICGNIKNYSDQILQSFPVGMDMGPHEFAPALVSCDSIKIGRTLYVPSGKALAGSPVTFQYTVHPPGGAPDVVITKTFGTGFYYTTIHPFYAVGNYINIPFYYNQAYTYDLTITDGCGNTYATGVQNINLQFDMYVYTPASACSGKYAYFAPKSAFSAPFTVEFLSAPAGFVPQDYDEGGA
jgi:hypothetical protein